MGVLIANALNFVLHPIANVAVAVMWEVRCNAPMRMLWEQGQAKLGYLTVTAAEARSAAQFSSVGVEQLPGSDSSHGSILVLLML